MAIGSLVSLLAVIACHDDDVVSEDGILGFVVLLNAACIFAIARRKLLRAVNADRHYLWIDQVAPPLLDRRPEVGSPQP